MRLYVCMNWMNWPIFIIYVFVEIYIESIFAYVKYLYNVTNYSPGIQLFDSNVIAFLNKI